MSTHNIELFMVSQHTFFAYPENCPKLFFTPVYIQPFVNVTNAFIIIQVADMDSIRRMEGEKLLQ